MGWGREGSAGKQKTQGGEIKEKRRWGRAREKKNNVDKER